MIADIAPLVALAVVGFGASELYDRLISPRMPEAWHRFWAAVMKWYLHIPRKLIPDRLYKLWLQTGIMDDESYQWFQQQGYIKDDLDPQYFQKHD